MQTLSIEASEYSDELAEWLKKELESSPNSFISIEVSNIQTLHDPILIKCALEDESLSDRMEHVKKNITARVCCVLADFILWKYEEKLISRIINTNYCYFNVLEKKDILNFAIKNIRNDKNIFNSLYHIRRRNIIIKKLAEYFEVSDNIILDGFVNFRLKEYIKELEEIVDKAVNDFLMEREYKEFIKLLKYFVDIQEPKLDIVHVITGFDGKYILLDENEKEITNECIREFINESEDGEVNYDDLLVSSLITLAPYKIIIHMTIKFKNKELLETIKSVFVDKVIICSGCELCNITVLEREK